MFFRLFSVHTDLFSIPIFYILEIKLFFEFKSFFLIQKAFKPESFPVINRGCFVINNELKTGEAADSLKKIREELDDHLAAINESTEEIEMNYSYLIDIDQRLKFLEKKVDSIFSMLAQLTNQHPKQKLKKIRINENEQELFLLFYQTQRAIDYEFMRKSLKKSEPYVRACISSLVEKGVPIKKHFINRKAYFVLDSAFKELQTKKGIVNIVKTLTLDCFDQSVL
jgi:hypothetical protein